VNRLRNAALAAAFLLAGCRSSAPPVAPLAAAGPLDAWQQLVAFRDGSIESHARMRVVDGDRTRSFSATIASGGNRFSLTAFTPVGSSAFTIYGDGSSVVFVDHVHFAYWKGEFVDLAQRLRLPSTDLVAADLGWLLMGIPAGEAGGRCAVDEPGCIAGEGIEYRVGAAGLERVTLASGVTIAYDPAAFPPSRVVLSGNDGRRLEIDHQETHRAARPPKPPDLARYRCCLEPTMAQ
jgi:hypothetical protein